MTKDGADLHVERWRDHWVLDEEFDDEVEAMTVRLNQVVGYFKSTTKAALAQVGLQDFEYNTLHALMIRETPGKASPGELAHDLGVSNAGMTGRLDGLEKRGWLKRLPGEHDRRKVDVEVTRAGVKIWREAMHLRGTAEDEVAAVLTPRELVTLNRLLKKMTLHLESTPQETP
jgi:DNA-binding MarR family transcriptional regulator